MTCTNVFFSKIERKKGAVGLVVEGKERENGKSMVAPSGKWKRKGKGGNWEVESLPPVSKRRVS